MESSVLTYSEIQRYHDLGLGRGVNVTDPQMWRNKSHFHIRKASHNLTNIIGTEECGTKEDYEKEVSTVATQQLKIKLSLNEPSTQIKIGMDAQNSQSTTSTKMIAGTKVKTRTISFRTDFHDLPLYASVDKIAAGMPARTEYTDDNDESFETKLYSWILERIRDRQSKSDVDVHGKVENLTGDNSSSKLANYFREMSESPELEKVSNDCKVFVQDMGITHYVSAIELGALEYSVSTTSTQKKQLGAGAELGAGNMGKGGISGGVKNLFFKRSREEEKIGKIGEDGTVKRNTSDEAVIGFQIQPIYKLIGLQYVRSAVEVATREYIRIKADNSEGPFLISSEVNRKPVYWIVDEEHDHIMGTAAVGNASLFYIIPTGDMHHPSDFLIAYYGKEECDRKLVTNVYDEFAALRKEVPQLPKYLASDSNIFGSSDGPLKLHSTVLVQQARFSLHSRVQPSFPFMMCLSTPVSIGNWIEGEKFYINCSHRSFKIDGYIAMKRESKPTTNTASVVTAPTTNDPSETKDSGMNQQESDHTYRTVTVSTIKDPNSNIDFGMLFRLHSHKCKERLSNSDESDGSNGTTIKPTTDSEVLGLKVKVTVIDGNETTAGHTDVPQASPTGGVPSPTTGSGNELHPKHNKEKILPFIAAGGPPPEPPPPPRGEPPLTAEAGGIPSTGNETLSKNKKEKILPFIAAGGPPPPPPLGGKTPPTTEVGRPPLSSGNEPPPKHKKETLLPFIAAGGPLPPPEAPTTADEGLAPNSEAEGLSRSRQTQSEGSPKQASRPESSSNSKSST